MEQRTGEFELLKDLVALALELNVLTFRLLAMRGASALLEFDDAERTNLLVRREDFEKLAFSVFITMKRYRHWEINEQAFAMLVPAPEHPVALL